MFDNIDVMQTAHAMARHASQRQSLIARNVANADTPGYRAADLTPFAESYAKTGPAGAMRATRAGHLDDGMAGAGHARLVDGGAEPSPNGNSVSLETEMVKMSELRQQHDMALSIYTKARDMLRTSLGRGR